ncbi:uncharacterized protein LOC128231820 isoform X1 [Mya arenaria]|uniref:uncharacterized protein LOC128231820 isoform X1 n=1 Tax=Mya arenaria TaxID=6604 RepID=UPI0022E3B224|nr:uncharacterized protein LOC128231820 isoform X1 [Mya arenaria]
MWGCILVVVTSGMLVLAVFTPGIFAQFNNTNYSIKVNLETIECKMCPPGSYWIQHCSQDGGQAICQDCPDGRFTEDYNRAIYCGSCSGCNMNYKESREVVVEACTRFRNTKCDCKLGYWREEGIVGDCRKVSPCKPSYGVKKMANSHNDTTCEKCVNGKTFSNISSEVTPCQNCSVCPEGWVQKCPCNEYEDTVCIPKDEVEDNKVGLIVGVFCGVVTVLLLVGIILFCCCRNEIAQGLRNWHESRWRNRRRQENHDDEEQAIPLQQDRQRQENHVDEEQAIPLQQDRRRQENHDDEEQAIPLQQDRRRQENHDDEEQDIPLQQDRRRQENHVDEEQANPQQHDRRRQENHVDEEQATPLQHDRRRQENHDDEEQAKPLQHDRRRQENHDDVEKANPLQQHRRRQENHDDVEKATPLQEGNPIEMLPVNGEDNS